MPNLGHQLGRQLVRTSPRDRTRRAPLPALAALALCAVLGAASASRTALADQQTGKQPHTLEEIVVIAQRDEAVRQHVETALHEDRYVNDAHIAVTIKNGVVTLSGLAMDEWDLRMAKRIARRIRGVKGVIDDLEIVDRGD